MDCQKPLLSPQIRQPQSMEISVRTNQSDRVYLLDGSRPERHATCFYIVANNGFSNRGYPLENMADNLPVSTVRCFLKPLLNLPGLLSISNSPLSSTRSGSYALCQRPSDNARHCSHYCRRHGCSPSGNGPPTVANLACYPGSIQ